MKKNPFELIAPVLHKKLIFVHGKGGVGKTVLSKAIALCLSKQGKRTLWVTLEDPTLPAGEFKQEGPQLWHLNCDFSQAFEQYAAMKIGMPRLTQLFLKNKLMRYLAKAAPGVHELVLLGKIWFERTHYEHILVDMPSTGYGLALFQSAENFSKLFKSGPLHADAIAMLDTFRNSDHTGHVIVSLPEETPLRESLELRDFLNQLFPANPPVFLANRLFPQPSRPHQHRQGHDSTQETSAPQSLTPRHWPSPLASSAIDYIQKRFLLETYNLRIWRENEIPYGQLTYVSPPLEEAPSFIIEGLAQQLQTRKFL